MLTQSVKLIIITHLDNKPTRYSCTAALQQLQIQLSTTTQSTVNTVLRSNKKCHTESVWKGSYPFPWLFRALRKCLSSVKQCKCLPSVSVSPHLVLNKQLSRTKEKGEKDEKRKGVLDLKGACCRLGKQPDEERDQMREREGANYKSGCGLNPSTPPKHPQAASLALLQLHVWGSTLCAFPSFILVFHRHQKTEAKARGQHRVVFLVSVKG